MRCLKISVILLITICHTFSGSARSKKTAKRIASQNMLNHIRGLIEEGGSTVIEDDEDDDIPLVMSIVHVLPSSTNLAKNMKSDLFEHI